MNPQDHDELWQTPSHDPASPTTEPPYEQVVQLRVEAPITLTVWTAPMPHGGASDAHRLVQLCRGNGRV